MEILSLSMIPHNVLLVVSAFLFFMAMFGGLKLSFISPQKIQQISAILGAGFVLVYFIALSNLVGVHLVTVSIVHYSFFVVFFVIAFITSLLSGMFSFRPLQIVGLVVFAVSANFLLA